MNINEQFTSKYLKASDLQGRDVTVKMGRVEQEKVGDDMKLVLYFQGKERGMIINKTNANSIADVYGGETNDWYGQAIILFEQMVDFQGKRVPGLRVRAPRRETAPVRSSPQRQMADANGHDNFPGDDRDRVEHERAAPPRRMAAPAHTNEDMNDDIPF
jgi:hypothetical protein